MRAFLTVLGKDKPGIIARVSTALAEENINIEDISQTVLQGNFTMIMLISIPDGITISALKEKFRAIGEEIGVDIHVQQEDIFNAMHTV